MITKLVFADSVIGSQFTVMRDFHRPIGATTVGQWIDAMINESNDWTTIIE